MHSKVGHGADRTIVEAKMDKDRIAGAAQNVKGKVKEVVGKAVGDVVTMGEQELEIEKIV